MTDNVEKDIRNMLAIKHDIIKILIENETDNKISHEETMKFIKQNEKWFVRAS